MIRFFRTTFPAVALSAALALGAVGASATQARADSGDAARVLGGIIALYAIGRALDNRDDDRRPSQNYHVPTRPQNHYTPPRHQPRYQALVAPSQCYREFQTRDGFFRGYAGHCLQRSTHVALPAACAREYRTDRGPRTFYGGRCLAQYGWVREGQRGH